MRRGSFGRGVIGGAVMAIALSGCQLKSGGEDLVNGKELFVQECAACHILERAGATGVTGPNLDAAFAQSRRDGLGESTFRGVVHQQILYPNTNQQVDPKDRRTPLPLMPAKLVEGDDARDVAAYVAQAASKAGDDPGRLASVGAQQAEGTAVAENGTLDIPMAAAGLAYTFADAEAPAGPLNITSENPQSVDHNIAVDGNGVDEKGPVVQNDVSTVDVDLQPGEYSFYCSVPGHREGGMEGKLTIK